MPFMVSWKILIPWRGQICSPRVAVVWGPKSDNIHHHMHKGVDEVDKTTLHAQKFQKHARSRHVICHFTSLSATPSCLNPRDMWLANKPRRRKWPHSDRIIEAGGSIFLLSAQSYLRFIYLGSVRRIRVWKSEIDRDTYKLEELLVFFANAISLVSDIV